MEEEVKSQSWTRWRRRWAALRAAARRARPFALGILLAWLGVWFVTLLRPTPEPLTAEDVDAGVAAAMASATPPPAVSREVYQIILPSLVFIETHNEARDDGVGVGSGVVINDDGDILTALHVVFDATEIDVTFADGTRARAAIANADPANDIAVLQTSRLPELLVPAVLASPATMRIGDQAFAVGNPLGLAGSMSAGVISGFNRSLPSNEDGDRLEGLIQFDAAVNPGNSGGPLLNRSGQVIGIVTALASPVDNNSFTGIGFAVPINTAGGAAGAPPY